MEQQQPREVEPPLLRTKISVPALPPEFVSRPRLTEQIERGVKGSLTLVCAPAGYGKTCLLIEWARTTKSRVAWFTLDSTDNNRDHVYRYVISALQTLEPHLGEGALDFLQAAIGSGGITNSIANIGFTHLLNELSVVPQEMVLVLDNFQALEDPNKLQSAGLFLKIFPVTCM